MDWTERYNEIARDMFLDDEDALMNACRQALLKKYNKRLKISAYVQFSLSIVLLFHSYFPFFSYSFYLALAVCIGNLIFGLYNLNRANKYVFPQEVRRGKSERVLGH